MTEKHTTVERIKLLETFIETNKKVGEIEKEQAVETARIKTKYVTEYGKFATREMRRQAEEAIANVDRVDEEIANANRKTEKQRTEIIEKDHESRLKMLQESQKEEIEAINTFDADEIIHLQKQLDKELKLNALESNQKVAALKAEQEKLGAIDAEGVDHTAEFAREIYNLKKEYSNKSLELHQKETLDEAKEYQRRWDIQAKILDEAFKEAERKYKEDTDKWLDAQKKKFDEGLKHGEKQIELLKKLEDRSVDDTDKKKKIAEKNKRNELYDLNELYAAKEMTTKQYLESKRLIEQHYAKLAKDEELKNIKETADQEIQFVEQALQRKNELETKQVDANIDLHQREIIQQQALQAEGLDNHLSAVKAEAAADELARQKQAEKEKKQQEILAFFKLIGAFAEKGDTDAAAKALLEMGLAEAATAGFIDGTDENVGSDIKFRKNKVHDGTDGYYAKFDGREKIFSPEDSAKIPKGMTNAEVARLAYNSKMGFLPEYRQADDISISDNSILHRQVEVMTKEITELKKIMKNKSDTVVNIDKDGIVSRETLRNGMRTVMKGKGNNPNMV